MISNKPTIVLVHGAWSLPDPCYTPLKRQLESLGYEVHLPTLVTSGGEEVHGKTWKDDVKDILDVCTPLFDQGKEVAVICHSYGGVPATIATEGQSVEDRRRKGKTGGFKQIIFVAAFAMPQKDMDLLTLFGGKWPLWANFAPVYTGNQTVKLLEAAKSVLFGGLLEEERQKYFEGAALMSQDAFETPVPYSAADITIPKSYLVCTLDECVPGPLQEKLAKELGFAVGKMETGHFPFLTQPQECLKLLHKFLAD